MATFGIETYDAAGNILFSSRHMNVFYIDQFTMTGGSTSRSYSSTPFLIACQCIYTGPLEWGTMHEFDTQASIAYPSYTVDYSNGYPILNVNFVGGACPYRIMVYTWGQHL